MRTLIKSIISSVNEYHVRIGFIFRFIHIKLFPILYRNGEGYIEVLNILNYITSMGRTFENLLSTMDENHDQCEQLFLPICHLYIRTVVDSDSI